MPKPRLASIDDASQDELLSHNGPGPDSNHDEPLLGADGQTHQRIHLATLKEKRRLWWKKAFIDALFICSWYVICYDIS